MYSEEEITAIGVDCLTERLGVVGMEYFIKVIKRNTFDYTAWRQAFYDRIDDSKLDSQLRQYCQTHRYLGHAQVI